MRSPRKSRRHPEARPCRTPHPRPNDESLTQEVRMPAITKEDIKNYLKAAPMLEVAELVKELEAEFGVSAAVAMPMMMAGGAGGAGGGATAPPPGKDALA